MPTRRLLLAATAGLLATPYLSRAAFAQPQASAADLWQTLSGTADFSKFVALCQQGGQGARLTGSAQLTVFAPTNRAMDFAPAGLMQDLTGDSRNSPDPVRLPALLTHHMVPGRQLAAGFKGHVVDVASVNPGLLRIDGRGEGITVAVAQPAGGAASNFGTGAGGTNIQSAATLVRTDILCSNGVIHAIDKLLLP